MLRPPQHPFDSDLLELCRTTTVVTASERLAQALRRSFDMANAADGRIAWRSPNILAHGEFLRRGYEELLQKGRTDAHALDDHLQRLAWLDHAPASCEVDPDLLYDRVAAAWELCHAWQLIGRLDNYVDNDNQQLFRDWSRSYRRAAQRNRWVTAAELCQLVGHFDAADWCPATALTLVGFDVITPSLSDLIDSLRAGGVDVAFHANATPTPADARLVTSDDPEQELCDAIGWAGDVMATTPAACIGIVVPDVVGRYDRIVRQLDAVLQPSEREPDAAHSPYDISGGTSLAGIPVVADALRFLSWLVQPTDYHSVGALLESPMLRLDASAVLARSARLPEYYDALTFGETCRDVTLRRLARRAQRTRPATLQQWLQLFTSLLAEAGWPNLPALSSESFQAYRRFALLFETLGSGRVTTKKLRCEQALARLQGAARREMFAPQRPPAALQVLGYLESIHLSFTHLWVCGLDDGSWPAPPQPNPFLSLRLLRQVGVPRVDAASELSFARRMIRAWRCAAPCITFSHARTSADVVQRPSPLIGTMAAPVAAFAHHAKRHPQLQRSGAELQLRDDANGNPLDVATRDRGGSSILRDQSACPFRAYARYRLRLRDTGAPHTFPDAAERGTLVHDALRRHFESLLDVASSATRTTHVEAAVDAALAQFDEWPELLRHNERMRLTRLLQEWMTYEHERLPGRVVAVERTIGLTLGGLQFDLRIDRVNALESGGEVIVDYKTGNADARAMLGARPREPQLAMYALAVEDTQAVLCAQVVENACRIVGWKSAIPELADAASLRAPPAESAATWAALLEVWRHDLTQLADEYRRGLAAVAPRDAEACRECNLQPLCRIGARRQLVSDE